MNRGFPTYKIDRQQGEKRGEVVGGQVGMHVLHRAFQVFCLNKVGGAAMGGIGQKRQRRPQIGVLKSAMAVI